jgi:hypothetical protein
VITAFGQSAARKTFAEHFAIRTLFSQAQYGQKITASLEHLP